MAGTKSNTRKRRRKKLFILEIALFVLTAFTLGVVIYKDYHERPGIMERDSLTASARGTSSITLEWAEVRNTDTYTLEYREKGSGDDWESVTVESGLADDAEADETATLTKKIKGLKEGTKYSFVIRADNKDRKGFETKPKTFSTRKSQEIEAHDYITKLTASDDFKVSAEAETNMRYAVSDESVATVDESSGKVSIQGAGTATITVKAVETDDYAGAEKEIELTVYDSEPVNASGASARAIAYLGADDCEEIKSIIGEGSIHCPQGLAYTGDKYVITYGDSSAQRIVSYDAEGDGRSVSVPAIGLGHPNGFTYCGETGLCYSVRGWSSKSVTYSPETGEYGTANLSYGCSGIAYDRIDKVFYTSSRTAMRVYSGDGNFSHQKAVRVVKHSGYVNTQDCGGHAGILFCCFSGSSKHGTNYIDLYNMRNGTYLGSVQCELSEVESAVADDDGYLVIMSNYSSSTDYIWRTKINIEDLAEGL